MKVSEEAGKTPSSGTAFPLGLNIDGGVFWVDLADPAMTSILIGGTSGSGKSVLLRSIVVGLLSRASPDSVSFSLIDPKRVTFTDMKGLRCLEEGNLLLDAAGAMKALESAVEEMELRYALMEKAGASDIGSYNDSVTRVSRMKRRVLVFDEYADMVLNPKLRTGVETLAQRICQKGRAAGVHLILATQHPIVKVVTGVIKANLQLRVALRVTSKLNSQIILGEGLGQARYLLGRGDMLVGGSVPLQRLQAPLASLSMLEPQHWKKEI
jgi:S-DNA-T family DNA segregation ATPase FtsK/SpoIIIE